MVNMNVVGKRVPCTSDYEVGVNNDGVIQYLNCSIYSDLGSEGGNENVLVEVFPTISGSYNADTWNVKTFTTRSDNPTSTWCRAPGKTNPRPAVSLKPLTYCLKLGTTEAVALIETIMDHIASATNLDSTQVRVANISSTDDKLLTHIKDLKGWADIDSRIKQIENFNQVSTLSTFSAFR